MEKLQSAAYILNLINDKIILANNDIITSFISMVTWISSGTVQTSRTKKHAATDIKCPSILNTPNIIKWARRQLAFRVPGIHSPVHIQVPRLQTTNTLSAAELQKIEMVVIQAQSMMPATSTVAPTVAPFTFDGSEFLWMLGWCGLNPTQDRLIPPVWRQLMAETTKTSNTAILTHILDLSNVGDEEVNSS